MDVNCDVTSLFNFVRVVKLLEISVNMASLTYKEEQRRPQHRFDEVTDVDVAQNSDSSLG